MLQLQAPAGEEITFVLPTEEDPLDAPLIRLIDEQGRLDPEPVRFNATPLADVESELDGALQTADEANRKLWELVKEQLSGVSKGKVTVKKGDQLARFAYPARVPRGADGVFELRILAPLASFVVATGGSISFAVALPRVPGKTVTVQQASAENPPGQPIGDISERVVLAQRNMLGHFWQNDPLYRVRYTYA